MPRNDSHHNAAAGLVVEPGRRLTRASGLVNNTADLIEAL